jgi:hypothetical protein
VADERDRILRLLSASQSDDLDDVAADAARAAGTTVLDADVVQALDTNRGKHCASCPLRNKCRDDAYDLGDLSIVSPATRPLAAVAGTARRAAAIVLGAATPAAHERALATSGAAARAELEAVGWKQRTFSA